VRALLLLQWPEETLLRPNEPRGSSENHYQLFALRRGLVELKRDYPENGVSV
jgi:hypothetical protein